MITGDCLVTMTFRKCEDRLELNETISAYLEASNRQQDALFRNLKSSAKHSLEVCLITIFAKTSNFSCTGHLYT